MAVAWLPKKEIPGVTEKYMKELAKTRGMDPRAMVERIEELNRQFKAEIAK